MWGLVLSGGGGKGAYETGVLKALSDQGKLDDIVVISGASVGALNGALLAAGSVEKLEEAWGTLSPQEMITFDGYEGKNLVFDVGATDTLADLTRKSYLADGFCSQDGLKRLMDEYLDCGAIAGARRHMLVNLTHSLPGHEAINLLPPEYQNSLEKNAVATFGNSSFTVDFSRLCAQSPATAKKVLLAATAMPYVYDPIEIEGHWYRDGGMVENTPLSPMRALGVRKVIVVRLSSEAAPLSAAEKACFDEVIDIWPSASIGDFLDGTIDFQQKNIQFRIRLGYYDTLRALRHADAASRGVDLPSSITRKEAERDLERVSSLSRADELVRNMNERIDALNKWF